MGKKHKSDSTHRGTASQFFVAGELCRRGLVAMVTLGNCPNTDIFCSDKGGKKFVHIQVKTFVSGSLKCPVGPKAEIDYRENFFWILAGIPRPRKDDRKPFVYYVIPSAEMAREVTRGNIMYMIKEGQRGPRKLNKFRSVKSPPHSSHWDVSRYENEQGWEYIEDKLK